MTTPSASRTDRRGWLEAPLLLPRLPSEVAFGFVGSALPTDLSAEIRIEAHRLSPGRARALLERAGAVAGAELATDAAGPGGRAAEMSLEVESVAELARRVAAREQELWRVGVSLHAFGRRARRVERVRAYLARRWEALGFRTRVPVYEATEVAAPPLFSGAERRPTGYWHTLHTDGVAAFFPFADESVAEPDGVLLGLTLAEAAPVFVNRWSHASHSWGIFGATGSGKSFAAALFAMRERWKQPGLSVAVLDPLGEFGAFARALGGSVIALGAGSGGRLNPLDPATTGGDRAEKAGRVGTLVRALFPSLRDEEAAVLDRSVRRLFETGPAVPTFSDLIAEVERRGAEAGRLPTLLEVFRSGSLRRLDGPTEVSLAGSPLVFDFRGVPDDQMAFHLACALDAVYGRIRASRGPALAIVDEAHFLVRHPATAEFLDRVVRHVRHFRAGLVVLSQNPEDFLRTDTGTSLLRNLRATLLLRLQSVSASARAFFGLTADEAEWLPRARLPGEAGYSEGLLRLGPAHVPLAVVASSPEYEFLAESLVAPAAEDASRAPERRPPSS
jgi:uncharacterized small protein (DUF1192 family)